MKLPFLFLSVVLIPLANVRGNVYVSEHNLTHYLSEDDFTVMKNLVFENLGDPFTYEGSIYFLLSARRLTRRLLRGQGKTA
jgi:hypothetical protein